MSLLDQVLASPVLPEPNEHAPSNDFVVLASTVADRLRAVGRETIEWSTQVDSFSLEILDGGKVRVWVTQRGFCTWIPGPELSISIVAAERKLDVLDRAITGLRALTQEG